MCLEFKSTIGWYGYADTGTNMNLKKKNVLLFINLFFLFTHKDAVDSLVQAAGTELSAAFIDNRLSMLVAAAFVACNRDFWTKIEAHVKFGTDSQQVVGKCLKKITYY